MWRRYIYPRAGFYTISLKAYFLECELKVPEITFFNCCELEILSIPIYQFILIPADFHLELVH